MTRTSLLLFLFSISISLQSPPRVPGRAMVADGRLAVDAAIDGPSGLAVDKSGNLYFASFNENRVYRLGGDGILRSIAGTGEPGFSGDGGPANAARLESPLGVAVDSKGNVYVADQINLRVRRISSNGMIDSVAGNGMHGYGGDGGPARDASIGIPNSLAVDSHDNLYISGGGHIRKITNGVITTVSTSNGHESISVDAAGNIYTVGTNLVWKITPDGTASVFAGNGKGGATRPGLARGVTLGGPTAVAADPQGNVYIATGYDRVWKVSNGHIDAFAGGGKSDVGDSGPATSARLNMPAGLAADARGNVYIADSGNHRIRKVGATRRIDTIAGTGLSGYRGDGGPATQAYLVAGPIRVAADGSGNIYVADRCRVRKVNVLGIITTVAGTGVCGYGGDGGPATAAELDEAGVGADTAGNLYIADMNNHRIRRVTPDGIISTVAGNGMEGVNGDGGMATAAQLRFPAAVSTDADGNLYIADGGIRKVGTNGVISTLIPGEGGYGGAITEALKGAQGVFVDSGGNVYVADTNNNRIRKRTPGGVLTTVAGSGTLGFSGDGGQAVLAQLNFPESVTADAAGNLFVADALNLRVRKIGANGIIQTVAGVGRPTAVAGVGFSGDGGPATAARLSAVSIAIDNSGNLYVGDQANRRVRKINPQGVISTFAGIGPPAGH